MSTPFTQAVLVSLAVSLPITVAIVTGLVLFTRTYLKDRSRSHYDSARHEAVLSEMRAAYEDHISRLTAELTSTKARWQDANHLLITSQEHQGEKVGSSRPAYTEFIKSLGIKPSEIEVEPKLVFVLTPFGKREKPVYEAIREVCTKRGFICMRGDETQAHGEILPHIVRLIISARLVIANVSTRNPNVFYELGIAHAIGKQTILVSRTLKDAPFDIQSKRIITFHNSAKLERDLTAAMLTALT